MSGLLKEIKRIDKQAAAELMNAGLQSDSDIQALTEDDLRDLFPGIKNIKRRRAIYDLIHSQPMDQILKKLRGFIPEASLTAALTNNGVLVDYLGLLMDMKTQMDKVMTFIEAHISFLKEYKTNPLEQESASSQEKVQGHLKDTSAGETHESGSHVSPSASDHPEELQITPSDGHPQAAPDSSAGSGTPDSSFGSGEYSGPDNHNTKQREVMSGLLKKIEDIDKPAADELMNADLQSDSDIQALTEDDLLHLFPGPENKRRRRAIYDLIHSQPMEQQKLEASLTESGSHVSPSASDHPEELQITPSDGRPQAAPDSSAGSGTSNSGFGSREYSGPDNHNTKQPATKDPMWRSRSEEHQSSQSERRPQRAPATSYKMVVGGKTFNTHLTLMKKIKKQVQNQIQSCEDDADNHSVTFVFCPISSRVASDVEAAMSDFKDDKPVILVLMHHTHQVKATSTMKTWDVHANVLLHVNVFYHETQGLLQCDENDAAVTEIGNKLLESFNLKSSITSGNAQGGGAERGGTGLGRWNLNTRGEKLWQGTGAKGLEMLGFSGKNS